MIKKTPFNYSNDMDRRRQGLDDLVENLLPDVSTDDAGKIIKVGEDGKWQLGDDENTIIEANPDEQPTVDLENLKIGSTVYSVKNPELSTVKSFKLTMSNGGQYNTNKPIIEFYNEAGIKADISSSDYTVTCDKTYAGNANMDQVCSISTPDTPGTFTYTFVNDFDIEEYNLIKLTRGGTFVNDIAKNIKIELSADGENYLTIYDETTITWSDAVPYHLISLKDGSEASTLLPIVTSADANTLLQVDSNGVWNKGIQIEKYSSNSAASIPLLKGDGSCIPTIPIVYIEGDSSRAIKDANDYYEVHCRLIAYTNEDNGSVDLLLDELDYYHIDFTSSMLIYLPLNDGTNNITLFGSTHWINNRPTSTKYANRIKGAFNCIIAKDIEGAGTELYTPYDITISFDDSRPTRKWTFKFKLAKITTT